MLSISLRCMSPTRSSVLSRHDCELRHPWAVGLLRRVGRHAHSACAAPTEVPSSGLLTARHIVAAGRGVCYNRPMRIAAPPGCVSVRIADDTWRRQVEQILTAAGLEIASGHAGRGPELVCVAAAPSSAHDLVEVVGRCAGEGRYRR